jgi:uncharacterized protein (DUF58 family)
MDNQKRTVLVDFVTTIAQLMSRHGNRVGALIYADHATRAIPARGGRTHVLRLIHELLKQPRLNKAHATDLSVLLKAGLHTLKRRSLVFVLSDFISEPGWEGALSLLAQKHEIYAIRLWDPREAELPDIGIVMIEDAETGEQLMVDTHDPSFRKRFREVTEEREAYLADSFRRAGIESLALSTEEDLVRAIVRFASLRRKRK